MSHVCACKSRRVRKRRLALCAIARCGPRAMQCAARARALGFSRHHRSSSLLSLRRKKAPFAFDCIFKCKARWPSLAGRVQHGRAYKSIREQPMSLSCERDSKAVEMGDIILGMSHVSRTSLFSLSPESARASKYRISLRI